MEDVQEDEDDEEMEVDEDEEEEESGEESMVDNTVLEDEELGEVKCLFISSELSSFIRQHALRADRLLLCKQEKKKSCGPPTSS